MTKLTVKETLIAIAYEIAFIPWALAHAVILKALGALPPKAKPLTEEQSKTFAKKIGEAINEGNVKTFNFSATMLKKFPVEEFRKLLSERVLNDVLVKEEENHVTFTVAGSYTHVRPLYYACEATDTGLTFIFPVGPTKAVDKAYKREFEGVAEKLHLELKEEMFSLDPKLDYFD